MQKALLVIDLQNDYFPGGNFELWNTSTVLQNTLKAIEKAKQQGVAIVLVQHIANPANGVSPFFNEGSKGVDIHPAILAAAPEAPIVIKRFADSFEATELEAKLTQLGTKEILVCGMMTQNCVTHTAISRAAEKYKTSILTDCCTTVSEIFHMIALGAVATRMTLQTSAEAF